MYFVLSLHRNSLSHRLTSVTIILYSVAHIVEILIANLSLGMAQCRSGVSNSTLDEIGEVNVGGKRYTVVHHNMVRITFMHKHIMKKLYDTSRCNIRHKFNLTPFREVINENNCISPVHGHTWQSRTSSSDVVVVLPKSCRNVLRGQVEE